MKITSTLLSQKKQLFTIENVDLYNQKSHFEERNSSIIKEKESEIKTIPWVTDGVAILDIQMHFSSPQTIHFEIIGESIILNFICCNNVKAHIEYLERKKYAVENTHNILYTNNCNATFKIPALEKINYFSVVLSVDFYSQLINNNWDIHPKFSKNIIKKKSVYLHPEFASFTPAMQWIIHEIKNCKYKAGVKKMYLEAKIKELLILQFDTLMTKPKKFETQIDNDDYNKLLEAKTILEANFTNSPTIPQLSRMVLLNEFKLKKGFKTCFDTTIKTYVTKLRMEYAKKLFKNNDLNVGEVAYKCGYKDVSHFSGAFKFFYGFTPISFRKINLSAKLYLLYWDFIEILSFDTFSLDLGMV